jgi:hypothetical protein
VLIFYGVGLFRSKWIFPWENGMIAWEQAAMELASNPEFITAANCPVP